MGIYAWQCLGVGNPTAKIDYFPSGTRRLTGIQQLKIDISRWEADCERVPCYDLTYLPHPNPCFALGSRLDRQLSLLRGYRPLISPALP